MNLCQEKQKCLKLFKIKNDDEIVLPLPLISIIAFSSAHLQEKKYMKF